MDKPFIFFFINLLVTFDICSISNRHGEKKPSWYNESYFGGFFN